MFIYGHSRKWSKKATWEGEKASNKQYLIEWEYVRSSHTCFRGKKSLMRAIHNSQLLHGALMAQGLDN
jgi:hypothetical protein